MDGFAQTIPVKHIFTDSEIEQMGRDLAREEISLKETQSEFAEVKADWKRKLDNSYGKITELSTNIEAGEIIKEYECEIQMNTPKEGKKTCTPVDGGKSFVVDMEDDDYAVLT